MSNFKVYPTNTAFEPSEKAEMDGREVHRTIYNSCVDGLLTMNEIGVIEAKLEQIGDLDEYDVYAEEFDVIYDILRGSEKRMQELHIFLGAFNLNTQGKLSKPDSERIDWESEMKPNLEVVK